MKSKLFILFALMIILSGIPMVALAQEDEGQCNLTYLFDAWAQATPEGAPTGAVFGVLVNLSGETDTLLSASTDVAEAVELNQTVMGDDDVMQMLPVEGGLVIPPNNYVELKSGGFHIMLINLKAPLEAGSTFDLTLKFEHMGEVIVTVPIHSIDETEDHSGMSMDMPMQPETTPVPLSASDMEWDEACLKMHVVGAWVRPAGAGMPSSAAYALLLNLTDKEATLVSANSEIASATQLHEMMMAENDVMQMRPIEGGIKIPAGGTAILQPGGSHVMFIGLTQELAADSMVTLTLTFENSGELELNVPVQEPPEIE